MLLILTFKKKNDCSILLEKVKDLHFAIIKDLFDAKHSIYYDINNLFVEIEWVLETDPNENYSYIYDQIVSIGEFLATKIMSFYLQRRLDL